MSAIAVPFAGAPNPERLLEAILPDIHDAVNSACHHYSVSQSEIDDFYHQVILLLMEDDYRRLRSFARRSSLKTWLTAVAMNRVSDHIRRGKQAISRDEVPSGAFVCAPTQMNRLIALERRSALREAVRKLTARERQLFELLCRDDLTYADLAEHMGIKVASVRRNKHALIKKLKELVGSPPNHHERGANGE